MIMSVKAFLALDPELKECLPKNIDIEDRNYYISAEEDFSYIELNYVLYDRELENDKRNYN